MRYDDRPTNGHHQPSFDLFGILLDLKHSVGGLEAGQELMREQTMARFDRQDERIDTLHERIDTHLATPKRERRSWFEVTGLSLRETVALAITVGMAVTGTLSSDILVALLTR